MSNVKTMEHEKVGNDTNLNLNSTNHTGFTQTVHNTVDSKLSRF